MKLDKVCHGREAAPMVEPGVGEKLPPILRKFPWAYVKLTQVDQLL